MNIKRMDLTNGYKKSIEIDTHNYLKKKKN